MDNPSVSESAQDKNNDALIIEQTKAWIQTVIIQCNFCPFAKSEFDNGKIHYVVDRKSNHEQCLHTLVDECMRLENEADIETTFIIYPDSASVFEDYMSLLEFSEAMLVAQGYEGVFQLASFHPEYCFAGVPKDDPANYTNRSLYPMLHIIRESSIERALKSYPSPENIPIRNIQYARGHGNEKMKAMLNACRNPIKSTEAV